MEIGEEDWSDMHDIWEKRVSKNIGVKKAAQRIAGLAKLAWLMSDVEQRHVTVEESKSSTISFDRVDDP